MLPPTISQYLPHVGLFFLFAGFVLSIVGVIEKQSATIDLSTTGASASGEDGTRYTMLAICLILIGGFMLNNPSSAAH